ncbi:MAG: hypothetical protein CMF50_03775 [Legionellales bacterium]|nr:hypothetical protein [Legionellales bacterium]|tara:strand:+ start:10617 stop:11351 length:735 start_codon:yes stop_codon:yes gene_type:complete
MHKLVKTLAWYSFVSVCFAKPVLADIYSVEDAKSISLLRQQLGTIKDEAHDVKNSYQQLQDTYQTAEDIKHDAEGHYELGSLLNDLDTLQRQSTWTAKSWEDALHELSGNNPARYNELVKQYQKDYPSLSTNDYQKGATEAKAHTYEQNVSVNQAAVSQASYEFENVTTLAEQVKALSDKIDQAPNTKAAIDLNSRLATELAYIQLEELRMQVLLNQQQAQALAGDIAAESQTAEFLTTTVKAP